MDLSSSWKAQTAAIPVEIAPDLRDRQGGKDAVFVPHSVEHCTRVSRCQASAALRRAERRGIDAVRGQLTSGQRRRAAHEVGRQRAESAGEVRYR